MRTAFVINEVKTNTSRHNMDLLELFGNIGGVIEIVKLIC
jgi:hypothetical protein